MPPLITATAKVHSADESQVGAKNGGGIYRWPEFDSRAGVSRLQPYPRLAHASYSLRKATIHPKNPVPLEPNSNLFKFRETAGRRLQLWGILNVRHAAQHEITPLVIQPSPFVVVGVLMEYLLGACDAGRVLLLAVSQSGRRQGREGVSDGDAGGGGGGGGRCEGGR